MEELAHLILVGIAVKLLCKTIIALKKSCKMHENKNLRLVVIIQKTFWIIRALSNFQTPTILLSRIIMYPIGMKAALHQKRTVKTVASHELKYKTLNH